MKLLARAAAPVVICLLSACGDVSQLQAHRSSRALTASANVLFIGNSLTATQSSATGEDMPAVLARLASSRKKTLTYKKAIDLGHTLQESWSAQIPQPFLTGATRWDFIVLQEYSTLPVQNPAAFYNTAVSTYEPSITRSLAPAGTLFLFENWALADLYPFATRAAYTAALDANYATLSTRLATNNAIAPLSRAFEKVLETKPQAYLMYDGKHPTDAAIYLNACVFYSLLFGESPAGLPPLYFSAPEAAFLQDAAAQVVELPIAPVPDAGVDAGAATDAGVSNGTVEPSPRAGSDAPSSGGCSSSGVGAGWGVALAALAIFARRRRRQMGSPAGIRVGWARPKGAS
jgi:MYXO-CTERM domain-containing protein